MSRDRKTGFTLIELSFSIAFIAVLLIAIAAITSNMIATYRRGLLLKQVNNYGTELVSDFRKSIANATTTGFEGLCKNLYGSNLASYTNCITDEAKSLISFYDVAEIEVGRVGMSEIEAPVHGVFCSGTYSYIWNSGYFGNAKVITKPDEGQRIGLKYTNMNGENAVVKPSNLRLLKVLDPTRSICAAIMATEYGKSGDGGDLTDYYEKDSDEYYINIIDKTKIKEEPIELLPSDGGNGNFAIYDLEVSISDQDKLGKNSFYSGSFILGTIEGGINIKASGDFCAPPGEYGQSSFDYCAINKFNFAMRATGE